MGAIIDAPTPGGFGARGIQQPVSQGDGDVAEQVWIIA
jgi:hypothetical protein